MEKDPVLVLDVGCGVGHWGREPILNPGTRVMGIDPEKRWIRKASARPDQGRCRFEYRAGSATDTGFPDAHFDLVTCQTALIHVPNVRAYLSDRAIPIFPPYVSPEQRIFIRERLKQVRPDEDAFYKAKCPRYFLAAGGGKAEFLDYWKRGKHWDRRLAARIRDRSYAEPGAALMHMVSCNKAAPFQ